MENVQRPWQGTTLAIVNIVGLVPLGLILAVLIFGSGILATVSPEAALMIGSFGTILLIPVILLFILGIFIIRGLFKGQKWAVILPAIFMGASTLFVLIDMDIISVVVSGFFLYLAIVCWKDPFYNQKVVPSTATAAPPPNPVNPQPPLDENQ